MIKRESDNQRRYVTSDSNRRMFNRAFASPGDFNFSPDNAYRIVCSMKRQAEENEGELLLRFVDVRREGRTLLLKLCQQCGSQADMTRIGYLLLQLLSSFNQPLFIQPRNELLREIYNCPFFMPTLCASVEEELARRETLNQDLVLSLCEFVSTILQTIQASVRNEELHRLANALDTTGNPEATKIKRRFLAYENDTAPLRALTGSIHLIVTKYDGSEV